MKKDLDQAGVSVDNLVGKLRNFLNVAEDGGGAIDSVICAVSTPVSLSSPLCGAL